MHVGVDVEQAAIVDGDVGIAAGRKREQLQIAGLLIDIDIAGRGEVELVAGEPGRHERSIGAVDVPDPAVGGGDGDVTTGDRAAACPRRQWRPPRDKVTA